MVSRTLFLTATLATLAQSLPAQDPAGGARYLDPASATWLSTAFTVIPTVAGFALMAGGSETAGPLLFMGGLTLGPSIGYFSAGRTGRGFAGFGIRTGVFLGSALVAVALCPVWCDQSEATAAEAVFIGGMVVTAGLAVYDIATVRRKQVAPSGANQVRVYPAWVPAARSPGLAVQVTF